jgi:hypothetical protein
VKHLIWVPVLLALVAVAMSGLVRQVTGQPHTREVLAAAGIVIVSCELALVPIMVVRGSGAVAVFQAAFGGTVIHMFLALALAAACHVLGLVPDPRLFLFLLLSFYFVSLIVLVVAMVRIFRRAARMPGFAAASGGSHTPPPPGAPTPQAT